MDTFGLVGMLLSHSFSKSFFTKKFYDEGIDAQYLYFELPEVGLIADIIASHPDLKGFNVTIPYKEQILPYLDDINKDAAEVGAVNVVKVSRDGTGLARLCGYNSDIVGFEQSLRPLLKEWHHKALVLGTGGASKAVLFVLRKLGIEATLVSRTAGNDRITYADITRKTMADNLLIINTTPLGMSPRVNAFPDIPYEHLTDRHLCYDLIYNPEVTLFLKKAQEKGAAIKNGEEMLILQAIESWRIWNE
ncbi:MAG: shikimate dehydrogenase [Muribaculaceae bacterium]|nr:shikimate dehydrogenase [Muribaculaceae bacterium]